VVYTVSRNGDLRGRALKRLESLPTRKIQSKLLRETRTVGI
jgi:hypothetical protein